MKARRICLKCRRPGFNPWVRKIPWRSEWLPTPVFLPGKSCGQRSLAGYRPRSHKELDTTERLSTAPSLQSFSLCSSMTSEDRVGSKR